MSRVATTSMLMSSPLSLTSVDFLVDSLHHALAAATRRKVLCHFGIPSLFLKFVKPIGQFTALGLTQLPDRCLDRFDSHALTLTFRNCQCNP